MMAFATTKSSYCGHFAAAYTSAHNVDILDTAMVVVSILLSPIVCVLCS